jgi:hypothetical protein
VNWSDFCLFLTTKGTVLKRSEYMSRSRRNINKRKTKKRNVVLFSALGVALLALLFLPKDALLMGNNDEPAKQEKKEPKHTVVKLNPDGTSKTEKKSDKEKRKDDSQKSDDSSDNEVAIDPKSDDKKKEAQQAEEKQQAAEAQKAAEEKKKQQAASDQPKIGEPIGTSQTGPHTSSYEEGSVDWNEKLKAIRMATGLDENMTVWKIANGGGPQKSVAEVSPNNEPNQKYVVNLEWVDGKGWKVTDVQK